MNGLQKALADVLAREGINQSEMARQLGVSRGLVSRLVTGKYRASLDMLKKLHRLYGIDPREVW